MSLGNQISSNKGEPQGRDSAVSCQMPALLAAEEQVSPSRRSSGLAQQCPLRGPVGALMPSHVVDLCSGCLAHQLLSVALPVQCNTSDGHVNESVFLRFNIVSIFQTMALKKPKASDFGAIYMLSLQVLIFSPLK